MTTPAERREQHIAAIRSALCSANECPSCSKDATDAYTMLLTSLTTEERVVVERGYGPHGRQCHLCDPLCVSDFTEHELGDS